MNFLRKILLIAVVAVFAENNTLTVKASAISPVKASTPQDELRQTIITESFHFKKLIFIS